MILLPPFLSVDIQVSNHMLGFLPYPPSLPRDGSASTGWARQHLRITRCTQEDKQPHFWNGILILQRSVISDIPFHLNEANFFSVLQEGKCWYRMDFLADSSAGRESACSVGDVGDAGLVPGSGRFPWRRKWQPTRVFLPEKSHRQRRLGGYSPEGCKESNTTKQASKQAMT